MNESARLNAVYRKLHASVLNKDGFGGPVHHRAKVEGWDLLFTQSDFGEVAVSARNAGRVIGFEMFGPEDTPGPLYVGTTMEHLPWLVDLVEQAEWKDALEARRARDS